MKIDLNTILGFYGRYVTRVGPMTLIRANRFHAVYQSAKNRFEKDQATKDRNYSTLVDLNLGSLLRENEYLKEIKEQQSKLIHNLTADLKC